MCHSRVDCHAVLVGAELTAGLRTAGVAGDDGVRLPMEVVLARPAVEARRAEPIDWRPVLGLTKNKEGFNPKTHFASNPKIGVPASGTWGRGGRRGGA
jgi:hypothetical protein